MAGSTTSPPNGFISNLAHLFQLGTWHAGHHHGDDNHYSIAAYDEAGVTDIPCCPAMYVSEDVGRYLLQSRLSRGYRHRGTSVVYCSLF